MAKLTSERDAYKERLAKYESPESPSSSAQAEHAKTGDSLEELEKKILAGAT